LQFESLGPLPAGFEAVVRPDWYPTPPLRLGLLPALGLTAMTVFARSLEARRRERRLPR
jgi:hypothetical protein